MQRRHPNSGIVQIIAIPFALAKRALSISGLPLSSQKHSETPFNFLTRFRGLHIRSLVQTAVIKDVTLADQIAERKSAFTVEELADILNCSKKSLYKMLASGTLPHLRVGSLIRLDPQTTGDWLRGRTVGKNGR